MNVILSFDTHNNPYPHTANVEENIDYISNKWNCKYIRINESLQPSGFHDMFTKLYLYKYVLDYDRCLYLDTDILIKHDTPNPFDTFIDDDCCYVVKDMQQAFLSDEVKNNFKKNQLCGPWYEQCKKILNLELDYTKYVDNFFNAGMFIFTPKKHGYIFDYITRSIDKVEEKFRNFHQLEQALINYTFMYFLKEKLIYIEKKWNYIDPPLESDRMEGYIYHFTGWYYQKYKQILPNYFLWKI